MQGRAASNNRHTSRCDALAPKKDKVAMPSRCNALALLAYQWQSNHAKPLRCAGALLTCG